MTLIEPKHPLGLRKQAQLLDVCRASYYYRSQAKDSEDLKKEIEAHYREHPCYGYRRMHALLCQKRKINAKCVRRLMRQMGLKAIYPGPKTTIRDKTRRVFPNRLKDLSVERFGQAYQTDITYLRTSWGFLYLVALLDRHSRFVVSWRLSNSLEARYCVDALEDACIFYGIPKVVHSDQGSQYTSVLWLEALESREIKVSMSGSGRSTENAEIERLWRSLKYEKLLVSGARSVLEVKEEVRRFMDWYNFERPHQSLGYKTPAEVAGFSGGLAPRKSPTRPKGMKRKKVKDSLISA